MDYKDDYGTVTSPIVRYISRILQAVEHTYLINGDFSDSTYHSWENYLNAWQKITEDEEKRLCLKITS